LKQTDDLTNLLQLTKQHEETVAESASSIAELKEQVRLQQEESRQREQKYARRISAMEKEIKQIKSDSDIESPSGCGDAQLLSLLPHRVPLRGEGASQLQDISSSVEELKSQMMLVAEEVAELRDSQGSRGLSPQSPMDPAAAVQERLELLKTSAMSAIEKDLMHVTQDKGRESAMNEDILCVEAVSGDLLRAEIEQLFQQLRPHAAACFESLNITKAEHLEYFQDTNGKFEIMRLVSVLPNGVPQAQGRQLFTKLGFKVGVRQSDWNPDAVQCEEKHCGAKLSNMGITGNKRHHCRGCGRCMCSKCVAEIAVFSEELGYGKMPQKCCRLCKVTLG